MNIAIFIDGENISSKEYKSCIEDIRKYGRISISNIYVDWTENKSWLDISKKFGITPIQCNKIKGKNSVDLKIAVDIMETIYEKNIDLFCMLTTDSDFCHIVQKLKSKNKIVYIYGPKINMNQSLLSICDKFIDIQNLEWEETKTEIDKYWDIIYECIEEKNISNMGRIKEQIIQECPTFDVKNYGIRRFSKFIDKFFKEKIKFIGSENITLSIHKEEIDLKNINEVLKEKKIDLHKIYEFYEKKYKKKEIKDYLEKNYGDQIKEITKKGEIKFYE